MMRQTRRALAVAVLCGCAVPASAAPIAVESALREMAALRGEPRLLSAAGVTRDEHPLLTIENPAAFDDSPNRRLVIVGGLDGDERGAAAVLAAVRWFKTAAPAALRQRWSVSALPLADPDRRAAAHPFAFPPEKGFFDDPAQPESRYVWRWVAYQAPDLVLEVRGGDSPGWQATAGLPGLPGLSAAPLPPDSLAAAIARGAWTTPAVVATSTGLNGALMLQTLLHAAEDVDRSPLHASIAARVARDPLAVARVLAARYPQTPIMSYIPAVAWTNMLRLAAITGEDRWRTKVREQTASWISGETPPLGDQKPLTSIAGYMIFGEIAAAGGNAKARALLAGGADLAAARGPDGTYANGRGWTDDMFMATAVLVRAGRLDLAASQLIAYAARLQRSDGVFEHAVDGPVAWGRGNGFAALGLMEALTAMPERHSARAQLLDIYQRQMKAMTANQAPDGSWREIIDQPGAYREETATAMLLAAMARGVRLGWLDAATYQPVVQRAWRALSAHIVEDGTLVDVCTGTGAGPTRRYYFDRPAIDGPDDRGGAMALLAAMELGTK
jgi:unsaturated rhamnogalacturonyl hydrolase